MKEMRSLQESLKKLPKHTLNIEQKDRIIRSLNKGIKLRKRSQFMKPFFAFVLICATVFALFLSSESTSWLHKVKLSFQPQIELSATEATVFKNNHDVIGVEGKVGILPNGQFVAEDARRGSKLMLYFWGDPSKLINKNYRVEAVNRYNAKINLSEGVLYPPLNGEDAHTLASFPPFPMEGKWQLSFFVEDQLFEEFTIEVLPSFPKTEHYMLTTSPKEIKVGEEVEITIESFVESKEEIAVQLVDKSGNIVVNETFVFPEHYINASDSRDLYEFSGKIKFPERGTWRLIIDGEKTKPFEN